MGRSVSTENQLVRKILDAMFADVAGRDEFDREAIARLRELREAGALGKSALVSTAIRGEAAANNEDP